MGATFTIRGSGTGAVKAVQDLQKAVKELEKDTDKAAKTSGGLERAAKRVAEQAEPQRKYNRQIQELAVLVDKGKISQQQAEIVAKRYGQTLERAGMAGKRAFGAESLAGIRSMIGGYVSMAAAISAVTRALQENAEERRRAEEGSRQAVSGEGSLAQLAATAGTSYGARKAALDQLTAESRGYFASGAFATRDEAGQATFRLNSAGLSARDRQFAVNLKRSGAVQDVGAFSEAYSAISKSLGSKEVGSFEQFVSKALQASSLAPAQANEIPLAASQSAGSAKALGISDEFLLAATGVLAAATGDAGEGGTRLASFLKQIEKANRPDLFAGKGGLGIIEAFAALPENQQGFGGILGDRAEAIQGARTLRDNIDLLRKATGDVGGAQASGLAGQSVRLGLSDPNRLAAVLEQQTKNQLELQQLDDATTNLLFNSALAERKRTRRARAANGDVLDQVGTEAGLLVESVQIQAETLFGTRDAAGYKRQVANEILSEGEVQNRELANAIRENTAAVQESSRRKPVTRQE